MQERTYLLYTNLKESDGVKMSKEYNCPVDATISKIGSPLCLRQSVLAKSPARPVLLPS